MLVNTVTVIGANGTMGRNISAIFAAFGDATVYMVSRSIEKSKEAKEKAALSVKADCIKNKLIPCDYSALPDCLKVSDLIFESVAEDMAVKRDVMAIIAKYAPASAFLCTGTSGLSILELLQTLPEDLQKNYLGVHMFNPPYNLTLCEVIPSKLTSQTLCDQICSYLQNVLHRTVVLVKDAPAFLGNRIGFQFINEAMQCAEKHQDRGGIDYVDAILGGFTGRAMAPLTTADFVGLDVHAAIVDNLYKNTEDFAHNSFLLPSFCKTLIAEKKLGRKTKEGLYKLQVNEDGSKQSLVYDIKTGDFRLKQKYHFGFSDSMVDKIKVGDYQSAFSTLLEDTSPEAEICTTFVVHYICYSLKTAKSVGFSVHGADDVMATGFNWCPPLALLEVLGGKKVLQTLAARIYSEKELNDMDFEVLCSMIEPSRYDYRKYIKATK